MNTGRGCVYHHWVHLKARAEVICQERRQCHHHPLGPWEGKKGISVCPSWGMQQPVPGKHCIGKCFSDARQTSHPHLPRCGFFSLVFRSSNEKLSNSIALQWKLTHQRFSLLIFSPFLRGAGGYLCTAFPPFISINANAKLHLAASAGQPPRGCWPLDGSTDMLNIPCSQLLLQESLSIAFSTPKVPRGWRIFRLLNAKLIKECKWGISCYITTDKIIKW